MTEFTVNGVRYIGVEVPEGAKDFEMLMHQIWGLIPPNQGRTRLKILPAGNYEIVGLVKDLPIDTLYPLEVGCKNSNKYMGQPLDKPIFQPNTLILKIKENE